MSSSFEASPRAGGQVLTRLGLEASSDPRALVPGDVAALRRLAVDLRRLVALGLTPLEQGMATAQSRVEVAWHGPAATAACSVVHGQRIVLGTCARWAEEAAVELEEYAAAMVTAQMEAAEAAADHHRGRVLASAGDPVGAAYLCAAAQFRLDRARAGLDERAARLTEVLRKVGVQLPREPSAWADPRWHLSRLLTGVVDVVSLPLVVASTVNPARAAEDPDGYVADLSSGAAGMLDQLKSPRDAVRFVLDADTLDASPAQWVGHLGPVAAVGRLMKGDLSAADHVPVAGDLPVVGDLALAGDPPSAGDLPADDPLPAVDDVSVSGHPPVEQFVAGRDYRHVEPPPEHLVANDLATARVQLLDDGAPVDGEYAWVKHPVNSDPYGMYDSGGATSVHRNVASYEMDRALGLGVTTPVRLIETEHGVASIQGEVPFESGDLSGYDPVDVDRAAALHYASGQLDGNFDNYRTRADGRLGLIDGDQCLYSSTRSLLASDFVADRLGKPLAPEVIDAIAATDRVALRDTLQGLLIDDTAIDGAFARMDEMIDNGAILGTGWDGRISDGDLNVVKPAIR